MFPAVERPRITEIQVRIDCNGCVQKIKKALRGINGIYDIYIDLPQQKLTIVGWADPEKIIKAIKKSRKTATICSHSEVQDPLSEQPIEPPPPPPPQPQPQPEPEPPGGQQPQPPPSETPRDQPPHLPPEHPSNCEPPRHHQQHQPKDVEEVHAIQHHPPGYNPGPPGHNQGYGASYNLGPPDHSQGYLPSYNPGPHLHSQGYGPGYDPRTIGQTQGYGPGYNPGPLNYRPERPQDVQVTQNYHQYRPPAYVTQYEYVPSSLPIYNDNNNNKNGYDTSMFNEEDPNACTIC